MNKRSSTRPAGAFPWLRFKHLTFLLLASSLAIEVRSADDSSTQKAPDLTTLPIETLMNMDVPKVYAASKVEQKVSEAPSSITIVTVDEIKKQGYRTLADVLENVQGFNVSYDRNYAFLGVRGISLGDFNSRVLLLVDGHRVNNNLTDGAFIDSAFILDIDLVDRVEIVRGPGSVLYGNNAFFGVINVITRQAKDINGIEASFDYGQFESYKGRVTFGKQFTNGLSMLFSGSIYESEGADGLFYSEFNSPLENNGIAQNMDGDYNRSFFGSLGYYDLTLEGAFNRRDKVNPTAQFDLTTFNDPRLRTTDERGYAALKFAHSFPDVVDVTAQVYYDHYTHDIGFPQSVIVGPAVVFSGFTSETDRGEWWGTELQLTKTFWERHVVTVGAEYRDDFIQEQNTSGQVPVDASRLSYGVYAQGDFTLLKSLHLDAGIRYDQYGHFAPAFDPRIALIYTPVEGTTFKAIYGTAFRAPNFEELSDPRFQNIEPEQITGYELVYEQELCPHLRSTVSGFYNQMDHLIVFNSGSFTNLDADTAGVEAAIEGTWTNGFRTRVSYSFQDTHNGSIGWQLPDSPNHLVKLNLTAPLWSDKLFAGADFQYTSDRFSLHNTTDAFGQPLTVQGETAESHGVVNLTLFSQNIIKNLELSASVYNLFNSRYSDPASRFHVQDLILQDGRSYHVKLTYCF